MSSPKNKYWHLEGDELEDHLSSDCQLSIIEPMETTEYFTPEERALMAQFPPDNPEPPDYDEVLTLDLTGARGAEVPKRTAEVILRGMAHEHEVVGEVFKTARYWCMRVKYAG